MLLAGLPALPAVEPAPAAAESVAGVGVTSGDGADQQQPSLAMDPRHPARLALAYQEIHAAAFPGGSQQRGCGLALSSDTGRTWRTGVLVGGGGRMPVPESFAACWNPSVAFGPEGSLYYLFQVSLLGGDPYSHVLLAVSHDGGALFDPPRQVDPATPPHPPGSRAGGDWWPSMAVDTASGALHVTWSRFTPDLDASMILVASSLDGGRTLTAPVRVSPEDQWDVTGSMAAVGPGGALNIVWFDYTQWERGNVDPKCGNAGCSDGGYTEAERVVALHHLYAEQGARYDFTQGVGCESFSSTIERYRTVPGPFTERGGECDLPGLVRGAVSHDGAAGFRQMAIPGTPVYVGCQVGVTAHGDPAATVYGGPPPRPPQHVCDRTHFSNFDHNLVTMAAGTAAGQVLAGWWNDNTPDASGVARISVALSSDGGQSWRMVTPVGVPEGGEVDEQHRPALAVAPSGRVDLLYYDLTPSGDEHVRLASAVRSGAAFGVPQRLNRQPLNAGVGPVSDDFRASLGDHISLVSTDAAALVAWTGTRALHQVIVFARVPAAALASNGGRLNSGIPGAATIGLVVAAGVVAAAGTTLAGLVLRRRSARRRAATRA